MNEKITGLNLADRLAVQLTFPKRVADSFMHALVDTVTEGLQTDGIVKVRGLGTFRATDTEERESVSVKTGERITIPSFKKITFTPDDSIAERMNQGSETSDALPSEAEDTADAEPTTIEIPSVEEFFSVIANGEKTPDVPTDEPEQPVTEVPQDQLSGIDVLISTPESLDDMRARLAEAEQAQNAAEQAVAEAQAKADEVQRQLDDTQRQLDEAQTQVRAAQDISQQKAAATDHLRQLVENIEQNRLTELAQLPDENDTDDAQAAVAAASGSTASASAATDDSDANSADETDQQSSDSSDGTDNKDNTPWWRIPLILLLLLLIGAACYFVAVNPHKPIEWFNQWFKHDAPAVSAPQPTEQPTVVALDTLAADSLHTDSIRQPQSEQPETDSPSADNQQPSSQPSTDEPQPEQRPATHRVRRGDTLTKISMQYYGTKDSVRAIIRANNFRDPNNITEGAVVKLP